MSGSEAIETAEPLIAALADRLATAPLGGPPDGYQATERDQLTKASVAMVMGLADAIGSMMRSREQALLLRLATAERRLAALEQNLEGSHG